MSDEWVAKRKARRDCVMTNINDYFDCAMATLELQMETSTCPTNMVSKLPDAPQEDAIYLSSCDAEPVIVVYDKGDKEDGPKIAVSKFFVQACYEGKHGDRKESIDMLSNMICKATIICNHAMGPRMTLIL